MNHTYTFHYMFNSSGLNPEIGFNPYQYGFILPTNDTNNYELIHILNGGLYSIAQAISSSGNTTLRDGFIFAFLGAFSAFAFNLIQKCIEAKSLRLTKSGDAMLLLIKEFEEIAVRYWVKGHSPSLLSNEGNTCDEINIKAMLMTIDKNIKVIVFNLPRTNKKNNKSKLEAFSSDIYDLASGDDFEAEERPSNTAKAFAISKKCSEAKSIILEII